MEFRPRSRKRALSFVLGSAAGVVLLLAPETTVGERIVGASALALVASVWCTYKRLRIVVDPERVVVWHWKKIRHQASFRHARVRVIDDGAPGRRLNILTIEQEPHKTIAVSLNAFPVDHRTQLAQLLEEYQPY